MDHQEIVNYGELVVPIGRNRYYHSWLQDWNDWLAIMIVESIYKQVSFRRVQMNQIAQIIYVTEQYFVHL